MRPRVENVPVSWVPSGAMPTRARLALLAVVLVALAGATYAPAASADPGDIGFIDHVYAPLGNSSTASKPESKLWYAGGSWWSVMYSPAANRWRIYKLNVAGSAFSDTSVNVDDRRSTRADTLFDPATNKLYIASHVFTTSAGSTSASAANSARLYRYSFSGSAFTLDGGFPVQINTATSETVTIDKDSAGLIWATWVAGTNVYVNHSMLGSDGAIWGSAYVVPGSAAVSSDDISSLVHYATNKLGVMWSNQNTGQWSFATHADGGADSAANWTSQTVPTGFRPDDHMNLKAGDDGRVYAALKTSESGSNPLIQLAVRNANGSWQVSTYGLKSNRLTRPIVELDEGANMVYLFVNCPGLNDTDGENGGDICFKSTPMSSLQFAPGAGTSVIRDASSAEMNDASSTKQNVDASMGLYVAANNPDTDTYWHSANVLGGSQPAPVVPNFTAPPATGDAPLNVSFGSKTLITLKLATNRIPARGPLPIMVTNANGFTVNGQLSVQTARAVAAKPKQRPIKLKTKTFRVAARRKTTVKLRLPTTLSRLLKRNGKLTLRVRAKLHDPAGNARTVTRTLSPRLKGVTAAGKER
jgi:hypothetical protein